MALFRKLCNRDFFFFHSGKSHFPVNMKMFFINAVKVGVLRRTSGRNNTGNKKKTVILRQKSLITQDVAPFLGNIKKKYLFDYKSLQLLCLQVSSFYD